MSERILSPQLTEEKAHQVEQLWSAASGRQWAQQHSAMYDRALLEILRHLELARGESAPFTLVATGGYGRQEAGPESDLDIAVIPTRGNDEDPFLRAFFRSVQTEIQATFAVRVGYTYVTAADFPGVDMRLVSSLMDGRYLAGPVKEWESTLGRLWGRMDVGEFLLAKREEREKAMQRTHASPLVVEPDLKEGAGGLRCWQTANWMRMAMGERMMVPPAAYDLVLLHRLRLQALSGRTTGTLTRQRQAEMAQRVGVDMAELASRRLEAMSELHRTFEDAIRYIRQNRFPLTPHSVALNGEVRMHPPISAGEAATAIAIGGALGLDVEPIEVALTPDVLGSDVLRTISRGEQTLRMLDHAGVLRALLPEFDAVRYLIPNDAPHVYTVLEHTLRAIRHLDELPPTGFLAEVRAEIEDEEPLHLALLLHDAGKIDPSEPHEVVGERMARAVADRWRLPPDVAEMTAWLVRHHELLSRFIRLRDVLNPDTVREFAEQVQVWERVPLLALLTYADTSAVHPEIWTPTQEAMLQHLYYQTRALLDAAGDSAPTDTAHVRRKLARQFRDNESGPEVESFLDALPASYMLATPMNVIRQHYEMGERARDGELQVALEDLREYNSTRLTVVCPDAPGLLMSILGVIYANDLAINGLRACTTAGDQPMIIDTFEINQAGRMLNRRAQQRLEEDLNLILGGQQDLEAWMQQRGKDPLRPQEIYEWTYQVSGMGVLEIHAPRGRGMAFRMSRRITQLGWNILSARLGQWGGHGAATFYLVNDELQAPSEEQVRASLGQ